MAPIAVKPKNPLSNKWYSCCQRGASEMHIFKWNYYTFLQLDLYWGYPGLIDDKGRGSETNKSNTTTWAETRAGGPYSPWFTWKYMNAELFLHNLLESYFSQYSGKSLVSGIPVWGSEYQKNGRIHFTHPQKSEERALWDAPRSGV